MQHHIRIAFFFIVEKIIYLFMLYKITQETYLH